MLVEEYKEDGRMIRIRAQIIVERDSQKGIIIGRGGEMLQKLEENQELIWRNFE